MDSVWFCLLLLFPKPLFEAQMEEENRIKLSKRRPILNREKYLVANILVHLIFVARESITGHLSRCSHRRDTNSDFSLHSSGRERLSEETIVSVPALQRAHRQTSLPAWRLASHYFSLTVCIFLMEIF